MGCGQEAFIAKNIVLSLQELGRCTLDKVNNPSETTIWSQGWLLTQELGLIDEMS